jgi:hypothetical protein
MMGWGKAYDNQLEVEALPKENKSSPCEDNGENNDHFFITYKGI